MITHAPEVERKGRPPVYRMACPCETTSPWAADLATAELALERHRWENHLDDEVAA